MPRGNYEKFKEMEELLNSMNLICINPRSLSIPEGTATQDIQKVMMKKSVIELFQCDSMVLLEGWEKSGGSLIEYSLAKYFGMPVFNHKLQEIE